MIWILLWLLTTVAVADMGPWFLSEATYRTTSVVWQLPASLVVTLALLGWRKEK